MIMKYQSSPMRCYQDADHCAVCRVIAGGREVADLLETVRILDKALAESQRLEREAVKAMLAMGRE